MHICAIYEHMYVVITPEKLHMVNDTGIGHTWPCDEQEIGLAVMLHVTGSYYLPHGMVKSNSRQNNNNGSCA